MAEPRIPFMTDRELFERAVAALEGADPGARLDMARALRMRLDAGAPGPLTDRACDHPRWRDAFDPIWLAHPELHDKEVEVRHTAVIRGPFYEVARQLAFSVPVGRCGGPVPPLVIEIERAPFEVVGAPQHELDAMRRSESGHGGSS